MAFFKQEEEGNVRIHVKAIKTREEAISAVRELDDDEDVVIGIFNLVGMDSDESVRSSDYLEGFMSGISGTCKKIGEGVFMCVPEEVSLVDDGPVIEPKPASNPVKSPIKAQTPVPDRSSSSASVKEVK